MGIKSSVPSAIRENYMVMDFAGVELEKVQRLFLVEVHLKLLQVEVRGDHSFWSKI
jgi:hypothetical protein